MPFQKFQSSKEFYIQNIAPTKDEIYNIHFTLLNHNFDFMEIFERQRECLELVVENLHHSTLLISALSFFLILFAVKHEKLRQLGQKFHQWVNTPLTLMSEHKE